MATPSVSELVAQVSALTAEKQLADETIQGLQTQITDFTSQVATLTTNLTEQTAKVADLGEKLTVSEAQVTQLTTEAKTAQQRAQEIAASHGSLPGNKPADASQHEAPTEGILEQFAKITDPAQRTTFYRKHEAEILAARE